MIPIADKNQSARIKARYSHLEFMKYTWQKPNEPLLTGIHTVQICHLLDVAMENFRHGESTFYVVKVPFRHGKALSLDTPIFTTEGWKTIETLKVGDYVFTDKGTPTKVIAKSPVWENRKIVKVDIDSGREIIYSDEEHLWNCKCDTRQKEYKNYTAKYLASHTDHKLVKVAKPLFLEKRNLLIKPYVLGLWLGNENSRCERIDGLTSKLKQLDLIDNKHIPAEYFLSDEHDRLELLRGLIDTDGEISCNRVRNGKDPIKTEGQVTFTNKNKQLAEDCFILARTLGIKASITEFESKLNGVVYKVSFYKKDSEKFINHSLRFEETDLRMRTQCIQVDSEEGIFLCGKTLVPTHNSDLLSRYLPAHFLGEFPDCECMLVTYASSLAEGFSRFGRTLVRSKEYRELYPDNAISHENGGVQSWGIEGHLGSCVASGLRSGLTGKGYHLGLLDDYCASRAEAESEVMRNGAWEHFKDDFLTRRAPTSITVVLATPWHKDDIIGRIEERINPDSDKYDPDFPPFRIISFPAMDGDVDIEVKDYKKYHDMKYHKEHSHYDYLFKERFTESWYKQQFASLGAYSASALLQCNPTIRGGNLLDMSKIKIHDKESEFPLIKYYRVWDLAHSAKQREKDDPDWTSGTLLGFRKNQEGQMELWIKHVARIRDNATERDKFISMAMDKDGQGVTVGVENSLDAKDAVSILKNISRGKRLVKGINIREDKVARMSYLEPIFDAGNVHILRGDWNLDWFNELKEFPSGKHDDQVDNLSAGYFLCNQQHSMLVGGVSGI